MRWAERLLFVCAPLLPACGGALASLESAPPQERAAMQERESCGREPGELAPSLLTPDIIRSVEPFYLVTTSSKHGLSQRLRGASVRLWARPGLTAQWLQRTLKCHEARRVLGQSIGADNDPYFLPNGWVEIVVHSDGDGFLVTLQGADHDSSEQILKRATAFAAKQLQ